MLHAGLDLSRNRLDVCLLSEHCEVLERFGAASDLDGLRGLVRRVGGYGLPVRAVTESMTGARFVHDTLEQLGWEVLIANAQKLKGLAPLALQDRPDRRARAGAAPAPRPGAGDLAARPGRARRAGALPAAHGQAPLDAQEPIHAALITFRHRVR
jgi:hypothetical protein